MNRTPPQIRPLPPGRRIPCGVNVGIAIEENDGNDATAMVAWTKHGAVSTYVPLCADHVRLVEQHGADAIPGFGW
ncbi:MAG TPA: hypothetical protein VEW95_05335 [Candidatus Limnocylindrales bacterium]|nr:hypothetical protein [Candidatus Limnocylindrales bacterium]